NQESTAWRKAVAQWEQCDVRSWTFGDLPERISVNENNRDAILAWPGLEFVEGCVNLRLVRNPDTTRRASLSGLKRLVELAIEKDLAWLEKDLRALTRFD